MRIYVSPTGYLYTEKKIISPIKWKDQDCDDSKNDTANILLYEVFSCLSIYVRIEIFISLIWGRYNYCTMMIVKTRVAKKQEFIF